MDEIIADIPDTETFLATLPVDQDTITLEAEQVEPEEKPDRWDRETLEREVATLKKSPYYRGLNLRDKNFCKTYISNGFVAVEAYKVAHPRQSHKSALANSTIDMKDPRFRLQVLDYMDQAAIKNEITVDWLLMTCKRQAEEGSAKALEIIKDWLGVTSKSEAKTTIINSEESRKRVRALFASKLKRESVKI